MSNETAFLSAIAATPEDEAQRLVFADWLEDQGDFRSEFVRAGVEYARTPPFEVARLHFGERLRELLESPPFRKWLPKCEALKWGWRRGFLSLTADTKLLMAGVPSKVADWLASPWIERVHFDGYTSGSSPDWEDTFGLVRNARELRFGTDNYGPDVLTRLREWPHLRWLSLSYLMEPWPDLAALPHLRALTLDNPDWTMMPELHEARLPNLEVLDLDKEWNDDLPQWGTCFPRLRSLTLTHYNTYPVEQCARFADCPQLRHLAFHQRYDPFTRVGLLALAKLKDLRSLTLGSWPRGTIGLFGKLPNLERLMGHGIAERVRGLEELAGLRWLSLGNVTFTKALAEQVLELPNLARLDLHCDSYEDGAIAALSKAPALRMLEVSVRKQTPPLEELARLEQLEFLRIGPPGVAPADLSTLQSALPGCRIVNGEWGDDEHDWG